MSDSALIQELAHTREALRSAISVGETLQARVDLAIAELETDERQLTDAELVTFLRGQR